MRNRALVVVGAAIVAAVLLAGGSVASSDAGLQTADGESAGTNDTVSVETGEQLSTVIAARSDEVDDEVAEAAFESDLDDANETERAAILADRAAELEERARRLEAAHANATAAYESGDITGDEYARRLALLNFRAAMVLERADEFEDHVADESELDLAVAGLNRSAFNRSLASLEDLTGPGHRALLARFTGENEGDIELSAAGGLSLEIESEDGERSREIRRPRDDSTAITVSQTAALGTARSVLSTGVGNWTLTDSSVHVDDGYYRFRFETAGTNVTGEAEVRVDGSSGEVFRIEEEIEAPESDDEDPDDDGDDEGSNGDAGSLSVLVHSGTIGPGETVTVAVARNGQPVTNASVELNGTPVGTTDADGRFTLTLPTDEAEIRADTGDRHGVLEFEFGEEDAAGAVSVDVSRSGNQSTLTATYGGDPIADAAVSVESDSVGTTDSSGTILFALPGDREEVRIEMVKGALEIDVSLAVGNDTLTVAEIDVDTADGDDEETSNESDGEDTNDGDVGGETDTLEPDETDTLEPDETDTLEPDETDTQEPDETDTPEPDETDTPEPNETKTEDA